MEANFGESEEVDEVLNWTRPSSVHSLSPHLAVACAKLSVACGYARLEQEHGSLWLPNPVWDCLLHLNGRPAPRTPSCTSIAVIPDLHMLTHTP